MSRKPEQRIADIILCCEKILRFTSGMNQAQLTEQELVMDAVLRNIEPNVIFYRYQISFKLIPSAS